MTDMTEPHGFLPHGICLLWDWAIVSRVVIGNALTALAYFSITIALVHIRRQNRTSASAVRYGLGWFAAFILLCGGGPVWDIVVLWYPWYAVESWWKLTTGVVSVITAVLMYPEIAAFFRRPRDV
jgi:hypothetical protein